MRALAIIPARGGSKGIPGKNLKLVGGVSLVARSIRAARAARSVARVCVSTDDPAIVGEAEREGAVVVRRPESISGDTASSESALLHALDALEPEGLPELTVFLQCTAPFTTAADIDRAVLALEEESADTCLTCCVFHFFVWRRQADGGAVGVNHDKARRLPRQLREPEFLENGAVYVMRTEGFRRHRHRFFGKTVLAEMPASRSFEIDEPEDLTIAEGMAIALGL